MFLKKKILFFKRSIKSFAGRNFSGKITVRHKSSITNQKTFFILNNLYKTLNKVGLIINIAYTFFYKKYIAYIKYSNGSFGCCFLVNGLIPGDIIYNNFFFYNNFTGLKLGSIISIFHIRQQSIFCNLNLWKQNKTTVAKASGTFCILLKKNFDLNLALISFPSGIKKYINLQSIAVLGRNSNIFSKYTYLGKAGLTRKNRVRPTTRGVAMNPVDHPHGGRTKTNKPEVSPWGWVTKYSH